MQTAQYRRSGSSYLLKQKHNGINLTSTPHHQTADYRSASSSIAETVGTPSPQITEATRWSVMATIASNLTMWLRKWHNHYDRSATSLLHRFPSLLLKAGCTQIGGGKEGMATGLEGVLHIDTARGSDRPVETEIETDGTRSSIRTATWPPCSLSQGALRCPCRF